MPQTLDRTFHGQIIAGMFTSRENANKAALAFDEIQIPAQNVQVLVPLGNEHAKDVYTKILAERGVTEAHARFYDQAIRDGKIMVVVYEVLEPAPVIDIFDRFQAEYNPDGSRNLRQDVIGMTTGAIVGAAALGAAGAIVAGPVGAVAGGAAGAVVGAGSGAAAGKAAEHSK